MSCLHRSQLTSPSLCHALPFWGYLLWLWRFFCPPSANLHSRGSVGAAQRGKEKQKHDVWKPPSCDPSALLNCFACLFISSHLYLSSISSSTLPPYGVLRQNSRHNQQLRKIPKSQRWQPVPPLALAGSI